MPLTLDDINKLLEHSFKNEVLRNDVWKDFYALLPPPIGIGYDEDFMNYLDGAFKINQKKIDLTNARGEKEIFKGFKSLLPITQPSVLILRTCGHVLDLEHGRAWLNFREKYILQNNLELFSARIEDDSMPIGARVYRLITAYKNNP